MLCHLSHSAGTRSSELSDTEQRERPGSPLPFLSFLLSLFLTAAISIFLFCKPGHCPFPPRCLFAAPGARGHRGELALRGCARLWSAGWLQRDPAEHRLLPPDRSPRGEGRRGGGTGVPTSHLRASRAVCSAARCCRRCLNFITALPKNKLVGKKHPPPTQHPWPDAQLLHATSDYRPPSPPFRAHSCSPPAPQHSPPTQPAAKSWSWRLPMPSRCRGGLGGGPGGAAADGSERSPAAVTSRPGLKGAARPPHPGPVPSGAAAPVPLSVPGEVGPGCGQI